MIRVARVANSGSSGIPGSPSSPSSPIHSASSAVAHAANATTTLHFVRHGEVENPQHVLYERLPGFHLSAHGRRQALATGRYFADLVRSGDLPSIDAIIASPLERTRETAAIIRKALLEDDAARLSTKLLIRTDKRLIEARNEFRGKRIGYGDGALWRWHNLKLLGNLWLPTWGERYSAIASRMDDFARQTVRAHAGEQVVVVTHESPIWSYRHWLETGHAEHNMLLRHAALASVTSITYDAATGRVLSIAYAEPASAV